MAFPRWQFFIDLSKLRSDAERDADEQEAEDARAAEEETTEMEGEIPSFEAVQKEIQETPNVKTSLARANAVMYILADFRCV